MKNNNIIAVFLMLAGTLLAPPAAAQAPQTEWLWSARAPVVNRSTEALAAGHTARAVRFALLARNSAPAAADRLIAVHNLCLALIGNADAAASEDHCRSAVHEAQHLPAAEDRLLRARGALVAGAHIDANGQALSLARVVRNNIARAYGARLVVRF